MSDSLPDKAPEDRLLEDYLHRKSALSLGYRRVYVEGPPPELDQAITARARRALRWLVPGAIAVIIGLGMMAFIVVGVRVFTNQLVAAEQNTKRLEKERQEQAERERLNAPVAVIVDPNALITVAPTRAEWLAKIEALKRAGKQAEAEAELKKFRAAYPTKIESAPK